MLVLSRSNCRKALKWLIETEIVDTAKRTGALVRGDNIRMVDALMKLDLFSNT